MKLKRKQALTEAEMRQAIKGIGGKQGRINDKVLRVRRRSLANGKGWTQREVDALIAKMHEEELVRVPKTHLLGTLKGREEVTALAEGGEKEVMLQRVRGWLRLNTEPLEDGRMDMRAGVMSTMVDNLRAPTTFAPKACVTAVRAAIVILASRGEVRVQARVEGKGSAPNTTWVEDSTQWAVEQGWLTQQEGVSTGLQASQNISGMQAFVPTLLELGTGYEGATEGLKRAWERVVTQDMVRQKITPRRRGDPGRWAVLEHKEEFGKAAGHGRGMVQWIGGRTKVRPRELGAVWASPSCKPWSTLQALNEGAAAMYSEGVSGEELAELRAVIDGILQAREANSALQYTLENVPGLHESGHAKDLGAPVKIYTCAYGKLHKKAQMLWMSPETRRKFDKIKRTPQKYCRYCRNGQEHPQAHAPQKGSGRSRVKEEGVKNEAARNRVATMLARDVGKCMREAWEESRDG